MAQPPPVPDDDRKKIIIGILTRNAKTGCQLAQLNGEYTELTGQRMTPSRNEALALLASMPEVVCENGLYYSASNKSKHIVKFVEEQREQQINHRRTFNPRYNNSCRPNTSFPGNRSMVSYTDWDSPSTSTSNNTSFTPRKIQDRRKSLHVSSNAYQQDRPKRRNSCVADRDEMFGPKPKRSRSKSPPPPQHFRNEHDDRWTPRRQPNANDRGRPPYRPRSQSRPRRSPSPRYPGRNQSRTIRSPSPPQRSNARQSPSPPPKRHSPIRYNPQKSPIPSTSKHISPSPDRKSSYTPENSPPKPAVNASTPLVEQPKPVENKTVDKDAERHVDNMPKSTNTISNAQPKKPKKFKFTVIGDGYMFYLINDMQGDLKSEMPFCSHNKTIAEALRMVEDKRDRLQERKTKVLISIGATDLRNNRSFGELKRDFTNLFLTCEALRLKPLITTVLCIDSPELKLRADMLNKFLMENFTNVVDMQQVGRYGLANTMLMTHNRDVSAGGNHMELGRLDQLILNL